MKFLAKTWAYATGLRYPSGLLLTALTVDAYQAYDGRLDEAFYRTLKVLSSRNAQLSVYADGIQISSESDVDRIERFRAKAQELVELLRPLESAPYDHDEETARALWKKVFRHSYFNPVETKANKAEAPGFPAILTGLTAAMVAERAEAAVQETNAPTAPWCK